MRKFPEIMFFKIYVATNSSHTRKKNTLMLVLPVKKKNQFQEYPQYG